jgi:hypothetical protein
MKICDREQDVLKAVLGSGLSDELRAHTATCVICRDLVRVASLVHEEFDRTQLHASVPTAEIVWWRAQMRARQEASRTAARPIVFTQALALAALIGLLVSFVGRLSLGMSTLQTTSWTELATLPPEIPILPVALALGGWLVLGPVALYLAFSRD